ncbi:MAG: serine/threonine protein kinase, partial [Propionibacteriaceae bacterium]|nr:serine/threonine protein kinase [Propionibacteriaceae bacterium]
MGRVLDDRYVWEADLGRGNMATVVRAYDPVERRMVAIKTPRFDQADTDVDGIVSRFLREAQIVVEMRHPNIAHGYRWFETYDAVLGTNVPSLVTEFVSGKTLRSILPAAGMPPLQAMEIVMGVLSGLKYAHKRQVIHRDIKPTNVMIENDTNTVKLIDFGIARVFDWTRSLQVWGTPEYISPEQLQGDTADERSDLVCSSPGYVDRLVMWWSDQVG